MVQKINPHPAPGCNRSPPTMYFQKIQLLGVFRPFLQLSLSKVIVYRRFCDFFNKLWTSVNEPLEAWSLNILLSRIRLKLKLKLIYRQILELFSSFSYFGIAFCNLSGGLNLGLNQQMYTYT